MSAAPRKSKALGGPCSLSPITEEFSPGQWLFFMTVRRLKTYAGAQGYVYQYYFVGKRPVHATQTTEYIFDVSSDLKTTYEVSIILENRVVAARARPRHSTSKMVTRNWPRPAV